MKLNHRNPLLAAILFTLAAQSAHSAPITWTGATAGTWNTAGNWSPSGVPTSADDITILGPGNVANTLNIVFATNSANSINFTNTAATTLTSVGGQTLTLGSGGITTGAGSVAIGANSGNAINITLNAPQTWNVGAGGLTVTNFVGGSALTKTGTGNLLFNTGAGNGFTGGFNVNGGTATLDFVNLATPTNLIAATNALQVNNAALTITGRNVAAATTAQTFAGTTLGAGRNTINIAKGALATSATLNLGALTANAGSTTIFSPTTAWTTTASTTERVFISAGGNVSIPGSGTAFANAGIFHRAAGGALGSLRLAAVNTGTGQLLLKGTAGNVANATTINDPTNTYQYGLGTSAQYSGSSSIYGLLLNATSSGLTLSVANSGTLTLNSVIQIKGTESVTIAPGTGVSNVVIGAERNLVIAMDNAAGFAISAPIVNNGGGASGVTIVGTAPTGTPGAVTFSGVNTYTGATTINNNVLSLNNANTLGTTPGVNGTSAINMTNGATLSTAVSGTNPVNTIAAPITLSGTGNATFRIGQGAASNTHTFNINGAIGGTTGNVVYTTGAASFGNGSSQFVLGAAGTYTGNTLISTGNGANNPVFIKAGTGIVNALPVTTTLTFDGTAGGGTGRVYQYDLNGNDQTLAGLTNTVANLRSQRVTNTGALATLTINNTTDMSFGGSSLNVANSATNRAQIQGAIALTKSGSGTFTLGGALLTGATAGGNTHTGATKILAGILVLGETLSLQNSAFDTANSIAGDATNGLRSTVTTLTLGGLTGGNDFSTRFTSTTGGYTGLTALTLNPGTGVTNTYSGDVGDGATGMTLTKTGLGTQVLSGTNNHTGATTVSAGTLLINGATTTASAVAVNNTGTLGGNGTVGGSVTVNTGGTLSAGNSIDSLATGALSFTTGSIFKYELDKSAAPGVSGDLTAVTGTLNLAGTVTLNLVELGTSGAWDLGTPLGDRFNGADKLTLISYTGAWNGGLFTYNGNLVPDDSAIILDGQQWWFNYNDTNAGDNFTVDLTGTTFVTMTVPEPNAAALLGALGTLILLRRRR